MKFLFRVVLKLLAVLLVLAIVAFLSWDWIVKKVAEKRIQAVTGMETHIGKFFVGVKTPVIHIENFKLYNPAEFGGAPLVDLPELHLEYDKAALRAGKVRLKLLRVNLAEVNLVRSVTGQTNINVLRDRLAAQLAAVTQAAEAARQSGKKGTDVPALGLDRIEMLNLTLGRLRFVDLARPEATREVDLGIRNQAYPNVKTQEELYGLAVVLLLQCGPELMEQFSGQLQGLAADGAGKLKQAKEKAGELIPKTP
jgi:uncharacterized protein involved in outer membrane biogenesis